ncbi:DNA ligase [Rivibacter subsaxonicus]|uniref:DNA ligase-1 n=1 Tax=Rivibacter subsaxonicus TaxID=457575 RepID=A0A4Q7VWE6_9BURK|nr:DNA ligase [Rivibacter subsaxonicus]RZU00768.1 DNA ligase-1 [Rivibacter subsaxonicus]
MPLHRRQLLVAAAGLGLPPSSLRAAPPAILLARVAAPDIDPAPYLVSEKLDGVRALWDGRELRFRSGRTIPAPEALVARLPPQPLDGELWLGRGRFDALAAIVRKAVPVAAEWQALRYMVFEAPAAAGDFAQRHAQLQQWVGAARHPQLYAVEQTRVADRAALQRELRRVLAAGGEGLMLHRNDAPLLHGRSDALLKLKPVLDAEAQIVAHVGGRGRLAGQLGALELQTPQGLRFRLGSGLPDALRREPPPLGATVTYAYRALTPAGLPRFASFVAVREDL